MHLTNPLEQLEPGHARQLDVGDKQVPWFGFEAAQGGRRIELVSDVETAALTQHPGEVPAEGGIVIDQQYAPGRLARLVSVHEAPLRPPRILADRSPF